MANIDKKYIILSFIYNEMGTKSPFQKIKKVMAYLKSAIIRDELSSKTFSEGFAGYQIDGEGNGELESLKVRTFFEVDELKYNKITVSNDEEWITDGGKIRSFEKINATDYKMFFTDGDEITGIPFKVGDILIGKMMDKKENGGFIYRTSYFLVKSVENTLENIEDHYIIASAYNSSVPMYRMSLARMGNTTDETRQRSIKISGKEGNFKFLDGVKTPTLTDENVKMILGNSDKFQPDWLKKYNLSNYNAVLDNVVIKGNFFQVRKDEIVPVPSYKGQFDRYEQYFINDIVTYKGSTWIVMKDIPFDQLVPNPFPDKSDNWELYISQGASVFITYHDNPIDTPPAKPTGNGTTDGWHITSNASCKWQSVKTSTSIDTGEWSEPYRTMGNTGASGKSVFVTYNDNAQNVKPTKPTPAGGNTNGWHTSPGVNCNWISQKTSYSVDTEEWGDPILIKGPQGSTGDNGISISYKGEGTSFPRNPEKNWVFRKLPEGIIYIYNGTDWVTMVYDGNDGSTGAQGENGLSVYITYNDNAITSTPNTPTGAGNTNGWHYAPSASCVWMSQKVAKSVSDGSWGSPLLIRGPQGPQGENGTSLPGSLPRTFKWRADTIYVYNDQFCDFVIYEKAWYKVKTKGTAVPAGVIPSNSLNPQTGYYETVSSYQVLATDTLLANEANLAGFIFKDDFLISQKGKIQGNTSNDWSNGNFIPNLKIDGHNGSIVGAGGLFSLTETGKLIATDASISGKITSTDASISGNITATSGSIGGFTIANDRIGVENNSTTHGLALYNNLIKFSDSSSRALIGTSVLPSSTGIRALASFENKESNPYSTNHCVMINVSGGFYNQAIGGSGDITINGTVAGFERYLVNPAYNTLVKIKYAEKVICLFNNTNSGIALPSRSGIAEKFGISTSTPFSLLMTIIISASSTQKGQLWGRNGQYSGMNSNLYPYRIDNNGGIQGAGHDMAIGDTLQYLLDWDGHTNYNAYLISARN